MMKTKLSIAMIMGGLLLIGAGCQQTVDQSTPATTDTGDSMMATTTPTADDTTPAEDWNSFIATSVQHGVVQTNWNAPTDLPADATYRLLHSSQPNVEYPSRAFWTAIRHDSTGFEWDGVPSGTRYFRLCVFENGACTKYSNEVELNVK